MGDKSTNGSGFVPATADEAQQSRRDFLIGLGRWSKVVIGAAVFGGLAVGESEVQAGGWINRRGGGGGWINGGGGGGGWVNGRGGGGGSWVNRR